MIKWKNDHAVMLYHTDNEVTHQRDTYTIDLTDHKFYLEDQELEWSGDVTDYVRDSLADSIQFVKERLRNNREVMYSTQDGKDEFEHQKAARHYQQNERLLAFIEAYVVPAD